MQLYRKRATDAFAAYTAHYNAEDPKVKLKIDHTYRVAALCEQIAKSLALPQPDLDLAWLCGLLHDVGRFEQLRRYGTFNDAASIDHAEMSTLVLFDEGRLRDYVADTDEDALLQAAVRWHSAYRLPEGLNERTTLFCDILRDADKIDILRANVQTPLEDIYNVTTEALLESPVSPAVRAAFYEHHCVLRALKQYPADNVVGLASLLYEMRFAESLRITAKQGWIWTLLDYKTNRADTAADFAALREHLHGWLAEQGCA